MDTAAFEALDNGWPFSSLETRQVRYWGTNRRIRRMLFEQLLQGA